MRKTITMLFAGLLLPVFSLMAQAPMGVFGNVRNNGLMKSKGEVIVSNSGAGGVIVNTGTLAIPEGVRFISDAGKDGLLHNTGTVTLPTDASKVVLRKNGLQQYTYYYISFPFAVNVYEILELNEANGLEDIWFYEYNSQRRADTDETSGNWDWVDILTDVNNATLKPMTAYSFQFQGENVTTIDFPAYSVAGLYTPQKSIDLTFCKNDEKTTLGWGWNSLGPAYTANYTYSAESLDMTDGAVYHYSYESNDYEQMDMLMANLTGENMVVAPYSLTFLKLADDTKTSLSFSQDYGRVDYPESYLRSAKSHNIDFVRIQLTGERQSLDKDNFALVFSPDYTESLNVYDYEKLFSGNTKASRIWGEYKDSKLFSVKLPFADTREIPLGFRAGEEGSYTISLDELTQTSYESIILVDKKSDIKTDLALQDYTFESEKGVDTDRFLLQIKRSPTSIDEIESPVAIFAENRTLYVRGLSIDDQVLVFDVSGKVIYNQVSRTEDLQFSLPQQGVYLVKIRGAQNRTSKVINK